MADTVAPMGRPALILGFAASEAAGRFAHHPRWVRDADFAYLVDAMADLIGRAANDLP
jgi:hypothetical protein